MTPVPRNRRGWIRMQLNRRLRNNQNENQQAPLINIPQIDQNNNMNIIGNLFENPPNPIEHTTWVFGNFVQIFIICIVIYIIYEMFRNTKNT